MDKSEQASSVYDKVAEAYARNFPGHSDYVDEFLAVLPKNSKILDAGCGAGDDAGYIASKGFDVTGIDLSKAMLKIAMQKYPQIHFVHGDIRKTDFPTGSFGGILASFSLIHIPKKDIPLVLEKFHLMLKEDGALCIALQEGESKERFVDEPLRPGEKLFLNVMSFAEIEGLLANAGFHVIRKHERAPKSKEELDFTKLFIVAKPNKK